MIVPGERQTQRLKWAFESCQNGTWGAEPDGDHDVICIRAADFEGPLGRLNDGDRTLRAVDRATYLKLGVQPGDLVMEKSGGGEKQLVGRTVIFSDPRPSVCSNFLARCRPAPGNHSGYINYLMLSIYNGRGTFPHIKQSTGIQNLDLGSYLDIKVSIPPLEAQERIARFLDEKTAQIDKLIAKKRALLDRLAEQRQAVITHAVTKGLNPNTPLKPSGIDWLGDIPAHWKVKRLRFLVKLLSGATPTTSMTEYWNGLINWISPKDMKTDEITDTIDKVTDMAIVDFGLKRFDEQNVVIVVRGMILARHVPVSIASGIYTINQDMKVMRSKGEIVPWYLQMYFAAIQSYLMTLIAEAGHGTKALRTDVLMDAPILVPPDDEQARIVRVIQNHKAHIDKVASKVSKFLDRLTEYRSALVTSAVTGQIAGLR